MLCGLLIAVAPLAVKQTLGAQASMVVARELGSTDSTAMAHGLSYSGMWDLPRSGIEPTPPALTGRLFTTEPRGKPGLQFSSLMISLSNFDVSISQTSSNTLGNVLSILF